MIGITTAGLLIPFAGTALGAFCVLFLRREIDQTVQNALNGFAAGVMVAASVWSLLIPAVSAVKWGKLSFVPAVIGLAFGVFFFLTVERLDPFGGTENMKKTKQMVLAVILHNIPEGMAVGAVFAALLEGRSTVALTGALALSVGIAVQNIPEGAIVSLPLLSTGVSRKRACTVGIFSGIVEPVAGCLTVLLSAVAVPILPYLLGFAAGAMLFVAARELIPESCGTAVGTVWFLAGFCVMMILDVTLG